MYGGADKSCGEVWSQDGYCLKALARGGIGHWVLARGAAVKAQCYQVQYVEYCRISLGWSKSVGRGWGSQTHMGPMRAEISQNLVHLSAGRECHVWDDAA